jgi:hypothetical protein
MKIPVPLLLVAFVLPIFLFGCNDRNTAKENSAVPKATIPTIDTSAPTETETATFAFG